jgi:(S)-sulfolactate dehydrogenase
MPDIVITEFMNEAAVADLSSDFDVLYDPDLVDDSDRLREALAEARAIVVRNRTQVDRDLLAGAARLLVVGRLGVGLDNIDLVACEERNIAVRPAIGANSVAVAEYVIGAMLTLWRPVFAASDLIIAGGWPRTDLMAGAEMTGKTVGLLGFGGIPREIAQRCHGLGMQVIAHDPYVPDDDPAWGATTPVGRDEVIASADALSIHLPLTPETAGSIDAGAIASMRPGALLINTARGGIVNETALVDALRSGQLAGAALDVFEHEPIDADRGSMFAGVPNLILTPHIAGLTVESQDRVGSVVAQAVRAVLNGS